jgi:tRNA dimethylallyltransferase
MQKLFFLTGPTAVGKSALVLELARAQGGEVLSCDSTNVYQGMDIGTAKPSREEQALVPHHGIDCASLREVFDIEQYLSLAQAAVEGAGDRNVPLWVSGGSGFYLKSFFEPVVDAIQVPPAVRIHVQQLFEAEGLFGCLEALKPYAIEGYGNLDLKNPRRVLKALERVLASGKTLLELEALWAATPKPYADHEKFVILLSRSKADLLERITHRTEGMIQSGLIEEVEALIPKGLELHPVASKTIGYKEVLSYLKGDILSLEALKDAIIQNTIRLVKKQRTFFRHQIPIDLEIHLEPHETAESYTDNILQIIRK